MTPLETLRLGRIKFFKDTFGPPNLCICPKSFEDALKYEIDALGLTWVQEDGVSGLPMLVNGCSILTSPDAVRPIFAYSDQFPSA